MKWRTFLQVLALVLTSWTGASAEQAISKRVLLVGIDGCRPDALSIAETPRLDALIKSGSYAEGTQIFGGRYQDNDTVSGPGWSSILTGVWADKHGVNGNRFRTHNIKQYPSFLARLKSNRPTARTAAFVSWKPIADHILTSPDLLRLIDGEATKPADYASADRQLTEAASRLLTKDDPDAVFVYLGNVDETGHRSGFHPSVKEYVAAIEQVDTQVGQLVDAVAARKTVVNEDWLILVGTDHGGRGTNHGDGQQVPEIRNVFLIISGPSAVRRVITEPTYLVDLVPTALTHLGVPIDESWQLDGRAVGLKP